MRLININVDIIGNGLSTTKCFPTVVNDDFTIESLREKVIDRLKFDLVGMKVLKEEYEPKDKIRRSVRFYLYVESMNKSEDRQ